MLDIHFTYFHIAFTLVLGRTKPVLIQFPYFVLNVNLKLNFPIWELISIFYYEYDKNRRKQNLEG